VQRLIANTLQTGDSSRGGAIGRGQERAVRLCCPLPYEFEGTLATGESYAVGGWKSYLMIRVDVFHPPLLSNLICSQRYPVHLSDK
jgi:hypothetical protein